MADLLECLIQISALKQSIARVERFSTDAPTSARGDVEALLAGLAKVERVYGRVGLGRLAADGPPAPESPFDAFVAERRANLDVLQTCSAPALGGFVEWPGRGPTTMADLVAIMLAHDTDVIGELQRLAYRPAGPPSTTSLRK